MMTLKGRLIARTSVIALVASFLALEVVAAPERWFTANPKDTTSNTRILLDGVFADDVTGESVGLFGLVHVQTKVRPEDGILRVHANVTEAFLAYSTFDLRPSDPRVVLLGLLQKEEKDLTARLADAVAQGERLEQQIRDALDMGNELRAAELQAELDQVDEEVEGL